ncbi:P-loop containing nucleoside triphosphate hydrolase protein [Russula earlei]|uniref:P-loop containing nucleoside triphosphate hydrolase protein n=1 Tax=Russula earlei TaxID=71964 RepID=A0ACC0TXI3_9AGAM|nr:P-loop containing nucleoside triphosphate hydrolase protein [Russula earlei]
MQGLWHRRKVNLNAAQAAPSASATPTPSPPATATTSATTSVPPEEPPLPEPVPPASGNADGASSTTPSGQAQGATDTRRRGQASAAASVPATPPRTNTRRRPSGLSDLGGVDPCVEKMLELVAMPLTHPEIYIHTGVQPPRGVLLHGPPGCGKTMLANAIGGELGVPFISVSAPSIVSGMSGESEKTLRETFEEAKRVAPSLLFIDEIDAITPKRESAQREMERRIVAQFLTCMDELSWEKTDDKPVVVIGATNRPDALDPALRRAGRFDHEIGMSVPDDQARAQILRVMCAKLRLDGTFDYVALAKATPGYVGADLSALTGAAGIIAVKRIFKNLSHGAFVITGDSSSAAAGDAHAPMQLDVSPLAAVSTPSPDARPGPFPQLKASSFTHPSSIARFLRSHPDPLTPAQLAPLWITANDFMLALKQIQPSAQREGFATVPDVTWADVGALHATRSELHMAVVQPIRRPELFRAVGIDAPAGVLLWGPPGCGKTLLAKAVANESQASFISVKGPELLNKYVGESERAVRQVFARARASSPCIIFFDELDALVPRRDDTLSESSARVVNTLLTELDGLDARRGVFVLAATNRPDMLDPAMCRPGRLDKLLYVDLPAPNERAEIVRTLLVRRRVPLEHLAAHHFAEMIRDARGEGYSGADLAALVREAGVLALQRALGKLEEMDGSSSPPDVTVLLEDLEAALAKVTPSVSKAQRRRYETLRETFASGIGGRDGKERVV